MPPRDALTVRQRRLGTELRKLRERSGLSSTAAAVLNGVNQARISNLEAGRYAVSAERVRTLARGYDAADPELIDALAAMAGRRERCWWEDYRDVLPKVMLDIAELEQDASGLRVALAVHIPGLLQTVDHARALYRETVPALEPYEVEHRVAFRIRRQGILHGARPLPYKVIIHEAALRLGCGGPKVARAQLEHLVAMGERDNITVLVIPFGSGPFPGSGQPIDYVYGPVPQLDTVTLDTDHGCEFLDAEAQLTKYRSVLDRLEETALTPEASRDLMRRVALDA
ncbi:helix-turn-helix domain-containing protein [Streptomyces violaceusniger]|uniref:Transcriptional regulator n=1 Tax=Streptomyces violaceusniger TaxID=68280 RepID=A0A4D4L5C7_STRVO|nr:transcriptional regulator [Streptomyces violaceusniger]